MWALSPSLSLAPSLFLSLPLSPTLSLSLSLSLSLTHAQITNMHLLEESNKFLRDEREKLLRDLAAARSEAETLQRTLQPLQDESRKCVAGSEYMDALLSLENLDDIVVS
jgi:hypothetical protein